MILLTFRQSLSKPIWIYLLLFYATDELSKLKYRQSNETLNFKKRFFLWWSGRNHLIVQTGDKRKTTFVIVEYQD